MRRIVSFLLITLCISAVKAQSYSDAFDEAFGRNDVVAQREALRLWQREAPDDVNYFIARYNFYANRALSPNASVVVTPLADSGLVAIDEGIVRYPDRLDLRLGKIFFLGELHRWDTFVDEIVRTLDYSLQIDHQWTFPNVQSDMMEELLVESMADYMSTMYQSIADTAHLTAADSLMTRRIQTVAKRTVQLFPDDFSSIYMLALSHLVLRQNEKAYKYLLRAEALDNTSIPILQSLVRVCNLLGKKAQAAEYQSRLNH